MAEEEEARVTALLACKLVRQFSACKADRTRVMLQELQSEAEAARAEFCTLSANQCKSSNQERRLFPCWRIYDSSFLRSAAKSSPPPAFTWIISRSTASACFTLPAERIWRFGGHRCEKEARAIQCRTPGWIKPKNPAYTQVGGREKLFEGRKLAGRFWTGIHNWTSRSNLLRISGVLA
jgi:hypothetical protein